MPSTFCSRKKRGLHEKVCENKDFCNVIMPSEATRILKFSQNPKYGKAPLNIYSDLECIIEKISGGKNNPENSFTTKLSKHIPYSIEDV